MFDCLIALPKGLGKCKRIVATLNHSALCLLILAGIQLLTTSTAQSYAGTYNDATNPNNELILTYEGDGLYSGVLFEDIGIYSIQANEEDVVLKGVILKSRSGSQQDVAFIATLNNGLLSFKTNLVNSNGEIDTSRESQLVYARPGTDILENLAVATTETDSDLTTRDTTSLDNISTTLTSYSVKTGSLTGEVIQPDTQYWGGTQLQVPSVGVAFQIPSAGTAIHTPPQQTLAIGHTSTLGNVAVMALSAGDFEAFVDSHLKLDDGQVLKSVSGPVETEDSYRVAFELEAGTRTSYVEVAAQKGPSGNMVLLKAKSRLVEAEDISLVVDMLLESLVFAETDPLSLQTNVTNMRISEETNDSQDLFGLLDICSNNEFRLEGVEDAEGIQIGLWEPAASMFSSGIVLNSIAGDFHYLPLESNVAEESDENTLNIEASPYCP